LQPPHSQPRKAKQLTYYIARAVVATYHESIALRTPHDVPR
jgi:hypothetical protein